jgi:LacI family transcriptional regulator
MQDVADAAGVHRTTVSLALRDSPRLPAAKRDEIKRVAERLGYRPHPMVSALMTSRVSRRDPKHQATLAFISVDEKVPPGWPDTDTAYGMMFRGARDRAQRRGYLLTPFWIGDPKLQGERFARRMTARNIYGLLIAPHFGPSNRIQLDWRRFTVVELGYNLSEPAFNRVVHDYYHSMQTACAELRAAGHRRIGLLMPLHSDVKTHHLWAAAYLHFQSSMKPRERLSIHRPAHLSTANVRAWIRAERPDVIVIGGVLYPRTKEEPQYFELPREQPYISLNVVDRQEPTPGLYQDHHLMGAIAADQLISQLQRGDFGVPEQPVSLLVSGIWQGRSSIAAKARRR